MNRQTKDIEIRVRGGHFFKNETEMSLHLSEVSQQHLEFFSHQFGQIIYFV